MVAMAVVTQMASLVGLVPWRGPLEGGTSLSPHGIFSSDVDVFSWSLDPRHTDVGDASSSERVGPEQPCRHFCHISLGSDESQGGSMQV